MRESQIQLNLLALALATALAGGCQTSKLGADYWSSDAADEPAVEAIPEALHLDVGIVRFRGQVSDAEVEAGDAFRQVRAAETLYFPQQLRQAMLRSGGWRNVWLAPARAMTDLRVEGAILKSNGTDLELEIRATDATGASWFRRVYRHEFTETDYAEGSKTRATDALFERIATDLLYQRNLQGAAALKEIRAVAELRFAKELAPEAFERYVAQDDGRMRLAALPAQEDTLYQLVLQVKERDDLFVESVQQYSENFANRIDAAYRDWARQSYFERRAHDEGVFSSVAQGLLGVLAIAGGVAMAADSGSSPQMRDLGVIVAAGGAYATYDAYQDYEATEIHEAALKELGQSLNLEVEAQVVQVENQTHTLTGSIEEQYQQWRNILAQVYAAERGGSN